MHIQSKQGDTTNAQETIRNALEKRRNKFAFAQCELTLVGLNLNSICCSFMVQLVNICIFKVALSLTVILRNIVHSH